MRLEPCGATGKELLSCRIPEDRGGDPFGSNLIVRSSGQHTAPAEHHDLWRLMLNTCTLRDVPSDLTLPPYRDEVHRRAWLPVTEAGHLTMSVDADWAGGTVLENDAQVLGDQRVVVLSAGELRDFA